MIGHTLSRTPPWLHYHEIDLNEVDFPQEDWLWNPDMEVSKGVPSKYWKVSGDIVSVMTPDERAVEDTTPVDPSAHIKVNVMLGNYPMPVFMLVVLEEFNRHSARINALLSAIEGATNLASLKAEARAISALPLRTPKQLKTAMITRDTEMRK